ncbi:MAG: hypothetical protein V3S98_01950 [Dehalococcoidia bacterium]
MRRTVIALTPILLLLLAACSSDVDPTPQPTATPPRLPSATVAPVPMPTPVPGTTDADIALLVQRFGADFSEVSAEWDTLASDLNVWRNGLSSCGPLDQQSDLDGWVVEFQAVVSSAIDVDFSSAGTEVAQATWAAALSTEAAGLSELRDTWVARGPTAFTAYEAARTDASTARQQARAELDASGSEDSDDIKEAVKAAESDWDAFHERFDEWRADNGGCDETSARGRISSFSNGFNAILAKANDIERPSVVRPLAEQLIDAALVQSQALQTLRATWVPYSQEPWDALNAGTGLADQLRRQVQSSVDELNLQYGLVPPGGSDS